MAFRSTSRSSPAGFTVIEILVVVLIIGVLAGLTVVAVQSAREAARRNSCLVNLKQIGIGIHQYISTHEVFPLDWNADNGHSFLVALLPYVDQKPLYNSINMNGAITGTVGSAQPGAYICPADGYKRASPEGSTNYAGNRGSGVQSHGYNGAFSFMTSVPLQSFTDGMSTTAAVSEWLVGPITGAVRDPRRSAMTTTSAMVGKQELDTFASSCRALDWKTATLTPAVVGVPWTHGDFGHSLYNHVVEINGNTCLNGGRWQEGAWTAKSNHAGGANTLFADGSVKLLKKTLDLNVWRAIGSRNGGEIVKSDSL